MPAPPQKWNRFLCAACYLPAITLAAAQAGADAPTAKDLSRLSLDDLMQIRVESVTTASKRLEPSTDAPAAVSIISGDEIRKLGHRSLADVLQGIRGFYVTYDHGYYYLGSRGFSRPGDYNSRTLLLLNGQRLNDGVYEQGFIGTEFMVDLDLIERVEVVRGPGSALYGSDALFGVINVITKRGADIGTAEASVEGGSFDRWKGRFSLGSRLKNGVDYLISGSYLTSDGQSRITFPPMLGRGAGLLQAINQDSERVANLFGRITWNDFTLETAWRDRNKQLPTGAYDSILEDPRNRLLDTAGYIRGIFDHSFENELKLRASFSYNNTTYRGRFVYDRVQSTGSILRVVERDEGRSVWWAEDAHLSLPLWEERVTLSGGFEARENVRQDQDTFDIDPYVSYLDDNRTSWTIGPYSEAKISVAPTVSLTAGVRHDFYSDEDGATTPRSALVWQPVKESTLKLLYGEAFRAPNAYERYYQDGGRSEKPSGPLKPERIETYEAVFEHQIGSHVRGSVSGYLFRAHDLINLETDPADGLLVYQNSQLVHGKGVEFELETRIKPGITSRISYTLQNATDEILHQELSNSPRHQILANLIVPLYRDKLFAGLETRYIGGRENVSGPYVGAYWIANATLFSQHWANGLEVSASVYNIFDHRYLEPGSGNLAQKTIAQEGRSIRVKLTYHF
jgi:iron complex outermembrane receptor protein